jgi:hypothetical protein
VADLDLEIVPDPGPDEAAALQAAFERLAADDRRREGGAWRRAAAEEATE